MEENENIRMALRIGLYLVRYNIKYKEYDKTAKETIINRYKRINYKTNRLLTDNELKKIAKIIETYIGSDLYAYYPIYDFILERLPECYVDLNSEIICPQQLYNIKEKVDTIINELFKQKTLENLIIQHILNDPNTFITKMTSKYDNIHNVIFSSQYRELVKDEEIDEIIKKHIKSNSNTMKQ